MGRRGPLTEPLVPAPVLAKAFEIRDGALVHRQSKRTDLVGEPAGFEVGGRPVVRVQYNGKTRRVGLLRAAWILHHGGYPTGAVQPRDGNPWNAAPENLEVAPHGSHKPWERAGGPSLERRAEVDRALLAAMATSEGVSLAELAELAGIAEGRVSVKLNRLAEKGLAQSPQCTPGRSWCLTAQGLELARSERPLLDDLDRRVLEALRIPMGYAKLSRRLEICQLTAKRRVNLLVRRGLALADLRGFYLLTSAGREALGSDAQPPPCWVKPEAVAAANSKDVLRRLEHPGEMTTAERSRLSTLAAKKGRINARAGKTIAFNAFIEFDRTG